LRCQAQALKVVLSIAFGVGHWCILEEISDRTPMLLLSVVHTTERTHVFVMGWTGRFRFKTGASELYCSHSARQSGHNPTKALAEA
jgi:hypothetical protein